MWSRRGWGQVCAAAVLATGLPVLRAQGRPRTRLVMGVSHKAAFCHLPLVVAERLGYFSLEGLDVQVREFGDVPQAVQALLTGAVQVLAGPYNQTIQWQARGQVLQSFVLQGRAPQIVLGVSSSSLGHYRQLRDLRGRRVGVTSLGSASHRMAQWLLLSKAGLSGHEVLYEALPSASEAVAMFQAGQIDAICYGDPAITQLEQGGGMRVVADTRTVRGNAEVFGGPLPAACLAAPAAFVAGQQEVCQSLADALVRALKWLQTAGPSDLIKVVPESHFQGDRALYLAAFSRAREAWTPDGLMPDGGPETAARLLAVRFDDAAAAPQRVELARTFTNEFARKAKARFRA